tara:strand:+ start:460 stop:1074 length:615 start_codon:yes stop_codon:yes gene_type:complete
MNDIILQKAFKHLSRDNVMNYLISKFSDKIDWGNRFDTNNAKSIANLIIEQQISFKAAITIKKRFSELIKNKSNLEILTMSNEEIQSVGVSHRKVQYIKNIYQFFQNNNIDFNKMSNQDVISSLTQIKGIGEWTAQMFLIFNLFRPNIFSPKDLALINSIKINYQYNNLDKTVLEKLIKKWAPYNSIACLLLWESVENKIYFSA